MGGEAEEMGLRRRTSGAKRDTGYQDEGVKEEKRCNRRWRTVGGGDVQVESQNDPGIEVESRVQQISEDQQNSGGQGSGSVQDMKKSRSRKQLTTVRRGIDRT